MNYKCNRTLSKKRSDAKSIQSKFRNSIQLRVRLTVSHLCEYIFSVSNSFFNRLLFHFINLIKKCHFDFSPALLNSITLNSLFVCANVCARVSVCVCAHEWITEKPNQITAFTIIAIKIN